MSGTFVSVIVAVYNAEGTLERCLKSIRNSTYKDYELIVVDDASSDSSDSIFAKFSDRVIRHQYNQGRVGTRKSGFEAAKGEIIVNIDADVVIREDALEVIVDYFRRYPEVDALTGLLSGKSRHQNFFSQYKSLYMHYRFRSLPERVTFLYGSIYAFRRGLVGLYAPSVAVTDDTDFGQKIVSDGRQIAFLRNLEVGHLKSHNFLSFIANEFIVPFDWAHIFIRYKGWKRLGKNNTGFAHASGLQIISVILAPAIAMAGFLSLPVSAYFLFPVLVMLIVWVFLNLHFIVFLVGERGIAFGCLAYPLVFFDHIVMATGIICGLLDTAAGVNKYAFQQK